MTDAIRLRYALAGTSDVVKVEFAADGYAIRLVRETDQGARVWVLASIGELGAFIRLDVRDSILRAWTFDGWLWDIDVQTGSVSSAVFTK